MLCFEIYLNGKRVCRAGGKDMWHFHTAVSFLKEKNRPQFVVNGMNDPSGEPSKLTEFVHWVEESALKIGDDLQVRVVDSEEPEPYQVSHSYGTRTPAEGEAEYFCSFCGKNARDVGMVIDPKANICHECLDRFRPKKDSLDAGPTAVETC